MVMMSYRSLYIKYKVHIQSDTRQLSTLNRTTCMLLCNVAYIYTARSARTNQTHTKRVYLYFTIRVRIQRRAFLSYICMCNVLIF